MNYSGAHRWSDGQLSAWWSASSLPVVCCPSCAAILWLEDLREIGEVRFAPRPVGKVTAAWLKLTGDRHGRLRAIHQWEALPESIKSPNDADTLEPSDWLMALQATSDPERERFLRHWIWWVGNNHKRISAGERAEEAMPAFSPEQVRENMQRLLQLYERDDKRQVDRGEILRQLGRFDEAVRVLKAVRPDGHSEVRAVRIQRLAQAGDSELRLLE